MSIITPALIAEAYDFPAWHRMHEQHVADGTTSGAVQSDELVHYTRLNLSRVKRIMKTTELLPDVVDLIGSIDQPMTWLVIDETWCGDAAQSVPVIARMAELNQLITLRMILRDEHLDVMDQFLTNGARSIPKIIILDEDLNVLADWGSRPAALKAQLLADKAAGLSHYEQIENIHRWYARDHTITIQQEFAALLRKVK